MSGSLPLEKQDTQSSPSQKQDPETDIISLNNIYSVSSMDIKKYKALLADLNDLIATKSQEVPLVNSYTKGKRKRSSISTSRPEPPPTAYKKQKTLSNFGFKPSKEGSNRKKYK
jgi:hypothetical protein